MTNWCKQYFIFLVIMMILVTSVEADVFNMGGTRNPDGTWTGPASLETVPVGNPGNTGEGSGESYGGSGNDAIVGAVDYSFRIGKYEVTNAQYVAFLNAVATTEDTYELYNAHMWSSTYGCKIQQTFNSGNYTYSVAPDRANCPVNYVSWGDAARFANWLHNGQPTGIQSLSTTEDGAYYLNGAMTDTALMAVNRAADWKWAIPTEDEWYKAAYHKNDGETSNYWNYPTGTDTEPNNGNPGGDTGNTANYWDGDYAVGEPYYTTPVGTFGLSASDYGTFDQGGNVWEWNEVVVTATARGTRGGFWDAYSGAMKASQRYDLHPTFELYSFGFRVASVPEPTSLTLLLGLALILVAHRKQSISSTHR